MAMGDWHLAEQMMRQVALMDIPIFQPVPMTFGFRDEETKRKLTKLMRIEQRRHEDEEIAAAKALATSPYPYPRVFVGGPLTVALPEPDITDITRDVARGG